jgi:hypothetical protein
MRHAYKLTLKIRFYGLVVRQNIMVEGKLIKLQLPEAERM